MSRKINFLIHPGYGKTGTTFLQKEVFSKINFIDLVTPYSHSTKDELINNFNLIHRKIFQPKYSFNRLDYMNYSYSVRNYVNILKKIIDINSNSNFILSDERLFNFENYFGYFNIYILKEISDLLSNFYSINLKFIISIRNQQELLISSFAYDHYRKQQVYSSFNNFINKVLIDKDEILQYKLNYQSVNHTPTSKI